MRISGLSGQDESLGAGQLPAEERSDQRHQSGRRRLLHLRGERLIGQLPLGPLVSPDLHHMAFALTSDQNGTQPSLTSTPSTPLLGSSSSSQ